MDWNWVWFRRKIISIPARRTILGIRMDNFDFRYIDDRWAVIQPWLTLTRNRYSR